MGDLFEIPPLKDFAETGPRFGPVSILNMSEVSGGGTSDTVAESAEAIEIFIPEAGRPLPVVFGEHLIAGMLIYHRFIAGSPNTSILFIALGEGQGGGGSHGEWDSAVAIYYNGALQSVSGSGTAAGYRFKAGFISTAVDSGNQPVDAFAPDNQAYSGTAYYAIKLTDTDANAGDTPQKLRGRFKGRKTYDFNASGINLAQSYSVNPARVAADRILAYYEHKSPTDAALALRRLQEKIDWDAWQVWRDFNAALISWNNGVTTVNIPRFETHLAFTEDILLADALDVICASACAHWQDDGEQIIFLPPTERDPVHHFNESNIIEGSLRIEPRDLRERPNVFEAQYRDTGDTFLGLTSPPPIRREALIRQAGEIKSVHSLTNMNQSQAQRLVNFRANLESDSYVVCGLVGDETSIVANAGDFFTVSHPLGGWNYQRFLVEEMTISSAEEGPDTCEFVLLKIDDALYSDLTHGPKQTKQETLYPTANQTPDSGQGGTSSVGTITNTGHPGSTISFNPGPGNQTRSARWSAFPTVSGPLVSAKLKVGWTEDGSITGAGTNDFSIDYSLNNGSNWTNLLTHGNITAPGSGTAEFTLSTGQNLTQVQVRNTFSAAAPGGGDTATITISMLNIRIEVEYQ